MTDFEKVTDFENLYRAFKRAKSGKGYSKSSAKFDTMALEGIHRIKDLLESREYRLSEYTEFKIHEPKERIIKAGSFADKIVGHSLCDNVLIPRLEEVFITNNFAGRKGKGTSFGLNTAKEDMQAFYDKHGMNGYILKGDVTKYYYSIDHDVLKTQLRRYFDDEGVLWLCDLFIDSTEGPGLPLGNQTSQVFGLLYLNDIDHFITDETDVEGYGRYTDDFYSFHQSKEYLYEVLREATSRLCDLGLTLNGKTQIMPLKQGIKFLGSHIYIENGEAMLRLKNENKRNAYRKYIKQAKMVAEGKMSLEKFNEKFTAYSSHAVSHGGEKVVEEMARVINEILAEVNNGEKAEKAES